AMTTCVPGWRADMTREPKLDRATTERAAEAWEVFHGKDEPTPADHDEFGKWMLNSPRHVEAYLRVSRTMQTLRSEDMRWPDTSTDELVREAKAHLAQTVTSLREESLPQIQTQRKRIARAPQVFALAATILLAIGAAWMTWMSPQTYSTAFGEQR